MIKDMCLQLVNERRATNGLEPISVEVLDTAGSPVMYPRGVVYSRDGWRVGYSIQYSELIVYPPKPFNYNHPRCPFDGTLYDEDGPVTDCQHDWLVIAEGIEQCRKCRHGRAA